MIILVVVLVILVVLIIRGRVSTGLKEALWWTVVFIVIAVVISAGVRIVNWVTDGETTNVWKAALLLVGASAGGGKQCRRSPS